MRIFLSTRIIEEITQLRKSNKTSEIVTDICTFFSINCEIETVVNLQDNLGGNAGFYRKKCDLLNSISRQKKGGYRIYFYVDRERQHVYLVSVYSKKKITNYSPSEIKLIYKQLFDDLSENQLQELNITEKSFSKVEESIINPNL